MKRKTVLKRTLACCLAVILMLTGIPLASLSGIDPANFKDFFGFKASAETWENLTYEVSDGEATITGCDNSISGDIVIPDTLGGYPVTSIFSYAFEDCSGLTSVTIPDSVTSIRDDAFAFCTALTSVTIPNSVTSIGWHVFYSCTSLAKITVSSGNTVYHSTDNCLIETKTKTLISGCKSSVIPTDGSVRSIGMYAFCGFTGLTSITIPNSVTSIGDYAFEGCTGLTSVTIGNSVTSIGYKAFSGCSTLTKIYWNAEKVNDFKIENSINSTYVFKGAGSSSNGIDVVFGDSVKMIPDYAFGDYSSAPNIKSVILGNNVESIGWNAFRCCKKLTSITIPASVTKIRESVFDDCDSLKNIIVDENNNSFSSSNGILFNKDKTEILVYPKGKSETNYSVPNGVISIGYDSFYGCSKLENVTLPQSVTNIYQGAFYNCYNLKNVLIPDDVTSIGSYAFWGCTGLTSITIPDSVTSIGGSAFKDCTGLTKITIPDSVTSIDGWAFSGCTGLTDVYYTGSEADWKKISIGDYNSPLTNATIHYFVNFKIGDNYGKTNLSFNPSWFTLDSLNYNHNLARLTSQFAMLGYAKKADLEKALKAIGFNVEDNYVDLNTSRDEVNYFIASKKIEINGKAVNMIFAGFIGSNKKQWNSNFDPYGYNSTTTYADKKVLKGKVHLGFNDAKNFVFNKLEQYVKDHGFTKENTKILLTGHSRGAATADLVAAKLIDEQNLVYPKNLYTYTFATPNSAKSSITKSNLEYKRIFNIINPEDFVVKVLPTAWKFDKFGTTYVLPSKTNSSDAIRYFRARMEKKYAEFGAGTFHGYSDGEKQPNNIVTKMTGTVHNLDEFYSKELKYTVVGGTKLSMYEYFQYTLCPFVNKSPEDSVEYKNARNLAIGFIATDVPGFYIFKPITWFFFKNNMISPNFEDAHRMETYCAYMMTMSSAQVEAERHSTLNTVNCPVDIEVYEKSTGELVGKITNNVIDEDVAAKENAIVMGVDGDSKSFWLPSNEDYEVKLIGNDEGTMDYTVANVDPDLGETERVNFFDVEITDGLTMTGEMKTDTALEDYSLEYDNGNKMTPEETLSGDEITSYNINVSVEGNGYATESMTASSGDYVTVNAMETVGNSTDGWYIFDGWYEDEEKVSSERSFSFVAKGNRSLIAKFVWSDVCLHPMQEELIEIPATCTESGNEPGVFCMMCETYLSGGKEIPALGHDIVTDIEAVKPTCTENGRTEGVHCTRCDYKVEAVELKPLGHTDEDNDRVCERCGKEAAIEGTCGENAFYKYYPDGELIISGTGAVTGFDGFRYSKDVLKVTVLDGITSLGYACFFEFCNMEEVIIGADLLEIKENAFSTGAFSRKLRNIEVSADNPVFHSDGNCLIKTETKELVLGCNNSVIPTDGSVTAITMGAFDGCDEIKELFIPKCVIRIDEMPIVCINSNLSSIVVEEGNPVYRSNGNCLINIETGALVLGCNNSVIPTDGSVKSICSGAFVGYNDLTELVIPASVTNIDLPAVYACGGIRKLLVEEGNAVYHSSGNCVIDTANKKLVLGCCSSEIPDDGSVEIIESASFAFIDSLNLIKIPEGVKSIMSVAFIGCNNMNTIVLPKSITSIDDDSFGYIYDLNTGMVYLNDSFTIVGYAGSFAEQYASNCGMHFVDLATHTHKYGQYTVKFEPTCTDDGMEERTCSVCGDKQTITVAALGHKKALLPAVSATCTETGLTEGNKCSVCGEVLVKQEEIPALGHDLVIAVEAKEATCTQSGTTEGVHCTRCDYKVEAVEIKPLGHTDEDNDGNCDRCGERIGDPAPTDPSQNCSCACHKKGIANFFFKIILFFQKIFKKNRVCNCGVWHY